MTAPARIYSITEASNVLEYKAPPRCPDELLESGLPDWCVRVWLAVRAIQGNNPHTECGTDYIADRAGKSRTRVSRALAVLEETGWVERVADGRPPHFRCHVGHASEEAARAAVEANKGANAGTPGRTAKVRAAHDDERTLRPAHFDSARRAHSPDTPYKEQSSIESGEEESTRGRASRIEDLPEGARRYRAQIEERATLAADDRERWAFRVLAVKTGHLVKTRQALAVADDRHGPLAVTAALVVTENEAESDFFTGRSNYLKSILEGISDHVRTSALAPDAGGSERTMGPPRGEAGTPGGGRKGRGPGGAGRVRGTAAERGSTVSIASIQQLRREHDARTGRGGAGGDGGPGDGPGPDLLGSGGDDAR